MKNKPKVSIVCLAYNQEQYISQAIDSFLMQKTNFPFEIVIHDDASTDKTADIIRQYEKSNPNIRVIYRKENQFSKGTGSFINDTFKLTSGQYIAFCEADDYWTNEHKLQLQSDFLDKNKDFSLVFHPVRVVFENSTAKDYIFPDPSKAASINIELLLEENCIQTNSVMYRRHGELSIPGKVMPRDWYMHLYYAQFGKVGYINKVMGVYRRHDNGVWALQKDAVFWERYASPHLVLYDELLKMYGDKPEYAKKIYESASRIIDEFVLLEANRLSSKPLSIAIQNHLPIVRAYMTLRQEVLAANEKVMKQKDVKIKEKDDALYYALQDSVHKDYKIKLLEKELDDIKGSRGWQALEKARKLKPKIKRS